MVCDIAIFKWETPKDKIVKVPKVYGVWMIYKLTFLISGNLLLFQELFFNKCNIQNNALNYSDADLISTGRIN